MTLNIRKILALTLAALLMLTACGRKSGIRPGELEIVAPLDPEAGLEEPDRIPKEELILEAEDYLLKNRPDPQLGAASGDWTVMALARAGAEVPEDYYENYYGNVKKAIRNMGGDLAKKVDTDSARTVMVLTAIGRDPGKVAGYDLLRPMGDLDLMEQMGLYGSIFTLIALDSGDYEMPQCRRGGRQATREDYIQNILSAQEDHGGWHSGGYAAEPGVTSMALVALAPYRDRPEVQKAVDRGVEALEAIQLDTGGYSFFNEESCMDTSQVILALATLGISPEDPRFTKGDTTLYSRFLQYHREDGGFAYFLTGASDMMCTERSLLTLTAVYRMEHDLPPLAAMTEIP